MIELALNTIKKFLELWEVPKASDIANNPLVWDKAQAHFVTIYHAWEIVGSSGSLIPAKDNMALELILNTLTAMKDERFKKLWKQNFAKINIRIDTDFKRKQIKPKEAKIEDLNPVKTWIIAVRPDYTEMAIILPNISTQIAQGSDYLDALSIKLWKEFKREEFWVYALETTQLTNF